ncbi:MAG: tetratricopeptide repeat protein [candidate division WOR-3 bacterium]|nr:MAG: tetratricopeptide repeat protein [candidate division WOR-3 bacterium]
MAFIFLFRILTSLTLLSYDESAYELFSVGCQLELDGEIENAIHYYRRALAQDPDAGQVYLALANAMFKLGKYDEGINAAERALSTSFDTTKIYYTIASGYIGMGDFRNAAQYYEYLLARDSTNIDTYNSLSMLYEGFGDLEKAQTVMHAVPESLKTVDVYVRLGTLSGKMNDHTSALEYYRTAYRVDSTDISAQIGIGTAFDIINVKDSAITYYERAFLADTQQTSVGRRLIELYTDTDRYFPLMRLASILLARDYNDTNTRRNLGYALYKTGRQQQALDHFLIASRIDPYDTYSRFYTARIYLDAAQYQRARAEIEQALAIAPDFIELWVYLGFVGIDTRDYETAEYALSEAAHRGGDVAQLYYLFGAVAEMQEHYEDAYFYYYKALRIDRDDIGALEALASLCGTIERREEAFRYFAEIIELDTLNATALNYVGYTYAEKKDSLDYALDLIQRAIKLDENNAYFIDSRGWVYFQMGMYEKAREDLERAAYIVEDAVILEHLGDVYLKLGDDEYALQSYLQALELDPDNRAIKKKITDIRGQE